MFEKLNVTRRSFAKMAAVVAGGAMLTGSLDARRALAEDGAAAQLASQAGGEVKRIRTACRGCGKMECGVWVTVKDGRAVKVEGDESAYQSNGSCCTKAQASIQAAYHPDRLHYPMKRTNPKGEDPGWVRISWDEAIQICHEKLTEVKERYGGEGIMTMTGTSRFWAMGAGRLGQLYGSVNGHGAAQICKGIRRDAGSLTIENGIFFHETVGFPKVYVQWGTANSMSNYDDTARTVSETIARSEKYILVDPRVNNEGKEADIHLALRPGTDGAMALGWTYLVMKNGWEDHTFCTRWSNGPFLYCEDLDLEDEPFFTGKFTKGNGLNVKTRLLRECDLVEGGSVSRFMVWDSKNQRLTYFDADETIGLWEGEKEHHKPTTFTDYVRPSGKFGSDGSDGDISGRIPDPTVFENDIEPELWYEGEVELKDGRKVKVKSVWQKYWDDVVSKYTPEYTAQICDVDPQLIVDAVTAWAGSRYDERFANGGLHYQLAPEQCGNALQNFRALGILSAMVGGYDCPGGNRGMTRVPIDAGGVAVPYSSSATAREAQAKANEGKVTEFVETFAKNANKASAGDFPLTRWTGRVDARCIWQAANEGDPYPIKGCICCAGDFLNQSNATYAYDALKQMDFFVDIDLWHHPTAELADVVLPAEHWLEIPGFARISQGAHGAYGANVHCIEPPGECRFEVEMAQDWYKYAGKPLYDPATGDAWGPVSRYMDYCVSGTGMTAEEYLAKFAERGWFRAKDEYPEIWGTYHRYETGELRQVDGMQYKEGDHMPGMPVPCMKMEIWSTIMETYLSPEMGYLPEKLKDYTPSEICLPEYKEPPLSPVSTPELFEEYPFNMTTGRRSPIYFHTEHRQLPWCRELWPVPKLEINPLDAAELGIEQGDWVWIESKDGKVRETADLFWGIKRGVVNAEHAWWYPENKVSPTHGWELSNINACVDRMAQDPFCGSSQLRAYPVKIYKATPENSPFGNPVPCDDDGTPIITSADDPRLQEWKPDYEGRA